MQKLILFTFVALLGTIFQAHGKEISVKVEEYILPADHPWQKKLRGLFNQVAFDSHIGTRDGGFIPLPRIHRGLMVMKHPSAEGLLFKKFLTDRSSPKKELANFIRRIEGARRLKALIKEKKLKQIVVPEKWLYPLKEEGRYILVVQKIDLLSTKKTKKKYGKIHKEQLSELCVVLNHMRGLDSVIPNMPFNTQNKIAFIDTERWEEDRPHFLHHAMDYLSNQNKTYAESLKAF